LTGFTWLAWKAFDTIFTMATVDPSRPLRHNAFTRAIVAILWVNRSRTKVLQLAFKHTNQIVFRNDAAHFKIVF